MLVSEPKIDEARRPPSQRSHLTRTDGVTADQASELSGSKPSLHPAALAPDPGKSQQQLEMAANHIPRQANQAAACALKLGRLAAPAESIKQMPEVARHG